MSATRSRRDASPSDRLGIGSLPNCRLLHHARCTNPPFVRRKPAPLRSKRTGGTRHSTTFRSCRHPLGLNIRITSEPWTSPPSQRIRWRSTSSRFAFCGTRCDFAPGRYFRASFTGTGRIQPKPQSAPCVQVKRERAYRKEAEALAAEKKATHAYALDLQKEVCGTACGALGAQLPRDTTPQLAPLVSSGPVSD